MTRVETAIRSRGAPGQEERRRAERSVRRRAVAFLRAAPHLSSEESAARLWIPARTLRAWEKEWRDGRMPARRRGPVPSPASEAEKRVLLALVALVGPRIGYGKVELFVPGLPRRTARRWLRRWRRDWARAHERGLMLLKWTRPGAVWAADFSEAPTAIEGEYPYVLSVRDLSSGAQLLALPCRDLTEATATAALAALFGQWGAPLVLKMDNGSAFVAAALRALLTEHGVTALYSPPRTPRYNGACEAGIGGLKARAHDLAAWAGRSGEWTCEDVERARCAGNDRGRPFGRKQPTPDQAWALRIAISREARDLFRAAVAGHLAAVRAARSSEPGRSRLALEERTAISRALTEHGYLEFKSRPISPPVSPSFLAVIA